MLGLAPSLMIRKSNEKYWFCIDFRKLNAVSITDAYPLTYMDAILRKLKNARYISMLDSSAYHQIELTSELRELTAFTVPGLGLFQLKRMPMACHKLALHFSGSWTR